MVDPQKLENIEPDTKSEEQIITYLEEDAGKIRTHLGGQLLPGQAIIYALLLRVAGLNTTAENVHDGWAAWRLLCRPNDLHKDLIPYDDLNPATQILDEPYAAAIREVAANQIESMPYTNSSGIPERLEELSKEMAKKELWEIEREMLLKFNDFTGFLLGTLPDRETPAEMVDFKLTMHHIKQAEIYAQRAFRRRIDPEAFAEPVYEEEEESGA